MPKPLTPVIVNPKPQTLNVSPLGSVLRWHRLSLMRSDLLGRQVRMQGVRILAFRVLLLLNVDAQHGLGFRPAFVRVRGVIDRELRNLPFRPWGRELQGLRSSGF